MGWKLLQAPGAGNPAPGPAFRFGQDGQQLLPKGRRVAVGCWGLVAGLVLDELGLAVADGLGGLVHHSLLHNTKREMSHGVGTHGWPR